MPGIQNRAHLGGDIVEREWSSGEDDSHCRLAQLCYLRYERLLRARQVQESAGMRFARKDLLFAQEQHNHVGRTRCLERGAETIPAGIAAVLQRTRVRHTPLSEHLAQGCEWSLDVFRASIHCPGAHLVDGAVREWPNHR